MPADKKNIVTEGTFEELMIEVEKIKKGSNCIFMKDGGYLYRNGRYKKIESYSITKKSIDKLIEEGWEIEEWDGPDTCYAEGRIIHLDRKLEGYERDKTLCHEIVHACYPDELSDRFFICDQEENGIIVEWLGRRLRANPELLGQVINSFGLKPYIYDKASCEAFANPEIFEKEIGYLEGQGFFSFFEEEGEKKRAYLRKLREEIRIVKMD